MDLKSLTLPHNQDDLIAKVAAANPHTIVVLETGNPVTMPWVDAPAAIVEAWYAGSDGANAVGNVLFGSVNPSGKLPNTFPKSDADLPRLTIAQPPAHPFSGPVSPEVRAQGAPAYQVAYDEGLKVGYKWYDAEKKPVLFPFGYGLSYTTFGYSHLKASAGETVTVSFTIKNTGSREGAEIGEVYATIPDPIEPPKRLIGWSKVKLAAGEEKTVTVEVPRKYLSIWDEGKNAWTLLPGDYTIMVGGSSDKLPLKTTISLK